MATRRRSLDYSLVHFHQVLCSRRVSERNVLLRSEYHPEPEGTPQASVVQREHGVFLSGRKCVPPDVFCVFVHHAVDRKAPEVN